MQFKVLWFYFLKALYKALEVERLDKFVRILQGFSTVVCNAVF